MVVGWGVVLAMVVTNPVEDQFSYAENACSTEMNFRMQKIDFGRYKPSIKAVVWV